MSPCLLVQLIVGVVLVIPGVMTFSCVTFVKDPNAPHIPKITSDSYQAQIELNIMNKNKTWAVEEYLDYSGNRAARIITEGNERIKYIYSFDTDEIFTVNDQGCTVVNMSSPEGVKLSFASESKVIPNDGDKRHVLGTAATFKLASEKSDFYAGSASVRGIAANKWSQCIHMGPAAEMQVTYYFSDPGWIMPINEPLPLRIEVEGNIASKSDPKGLHYFHHIYDFISYLPYTQVDPSMFETPKDVVCAGRLNTKSLPIFSNHIQYAAENIDVSEQGITHFKVWYDDGPSKMVRIDKRDALPQPPLYTTDPVTEIHDHNTGVRYIKDRILGNCSIYPLSSNSVDSIQDPQKTIEMSDPYRFFMFTKNYTYTGKRSVRGIQCDVYSAIIPNYTYEGVTVSATFSYYFLKSDWSDQPLQGDPSNDKTAYPVHLEIQASKPVAFTKIVNFFDFDDRNIDMGTFDVSDCFSSKSKLDFRVTFPGTYDPATEDEWKQYSTYTLANVMKISPIRIGNLEIKGDLNNVYLSGSLLGTSSQAQFQLAQEKSPERVLDKTYFSTKTLDQCADLCVKNKNFQCKGFQYCPGDGFSCGLSMYHVLNQTLKTNGKSCSFFTRTVSNYPYPKEPTVSQAYDALAEAIDKNQLHLLITNSNGFIPNYIAIRVQQLSDLSREMLQCILNCYSVDTKPMPSMTEQFSYRIETVVPQYTTAFDSYVWYDAQLKFVRLDTRDANTPQATEFSTIYDFNQGITYKISKVTQECEIQPISPTDDFDVNSFASKPDKNGGLQIRMKTPLEIFFMDDSYTYIGQKTVRGILCDGFQADRSDFHIKALDVHKENSVFTIYFQAENWKYYTADSLDKGMSQPVQLTIEDKTANLMTVYNVFDFDNERHTYDYFDVSTCYTADQTKSFQIIFKNQPFHPFLDGTEPTFKATARLRMGEYTGTSPVRFQHVSVAYDDTDVYVSATALGNVPPYTLFQRITNITLNAKAKTMYVGSYQDCAAACVNVPGPPCNSFDYCPGGANPVCSLLNQSDEPPVDGQPNDNGSCIHFSRSELGGYPILGVDRLYQAITNMVYDNKFSITIYLPGGANKTYIATDIRDDILMATDPASAAGSVLEQFSKTVNKKLPKSAVVETHSMVSITDCALSCKTTTSLHCETFEYNYGIGTCRLAAKHLDEITTLSDAMNVDVYTSFYTKAYKEYGNFFLDQPDKAINQVASSELCARDCNEETKFNCESFEYCPDQKTCNLRKDHTLPTMQTPQSGQTPACILYSRQHLYDYTKHSNKIIVGHDDLTTTVNTDSDCARLCANRELQSCASFEVCHASRGVTKCVLSLADPTLQGNLTTQATRECDLYTKSNPSKRIGKPGTTPGTGKGNTGTTPGTGKGNTGTTPGTGKGNTGTTPGTGKGNTGTTPGTGKGNTGTTPGTGKGNTGTTPGTGKGNTVIVQKQTSTKSDTSARVGIAFGTLFLGILVGAVGMFFFSKWRATRLRSMDDSHPLGMYN